VRVAEDAFVIAGIALERLTRMTNWDQVDAVERFQRVLEASGVTAELVRQGVQPGDTVSIAGSDLTWGELIELEPPRPPRRTAKARHYGAEAGED
jgi:GTP-binding protein